MSNNTIVLKRSSVAGKTPDLDDLQLGELAVNTTDGKLFMKFNRPSGPAIEQLGAAGPQGPQGAAGPQGLTGPMGNDLEISPMPSKTYRGRTSPNTGLPEDVPVTVLKQDLALVKSDVGLSEVDNTSDLNKPISNAQAIADAGILNTSKSYADSLVIGLWDDRGNFDSSTNSYPLTGGSGVEGQIKKGDIWTLINAATMGNLVGYPVGSTVRALVDSPSNSPSDWSVAEVGLGYVPENASNKNSSNGYVGIKDSKITVNNVLGTVSSSLSTSATLHREWVLPDIDGTIALKSDISDVARSVIVSRQDADKRTLPSQNGTVVGMAATASAGPNLVTFNAQYSSTASEVTVQGVADLNLLYMALNALPVTNTTHAAQYGNGETLSPGVYYVAGATSVVGTLNLDANNNSNAMFVFKGGAAFTTGAGVKVNLLNGARAANVFWVAEGAGALAANADFKGTILINNAALSMGDGCRLEGRLTTTSGAVAFTNATIFPPQGAAGVLDLGLLESFTVFTGLGAISNTGVSSIDGDMGTNGGAVTGFESSSVSGSLYTAGMKNSIAIFGVYANNVLVEGSDRTVVNSTNRPADLMVLSAASTSLERTDISIRLKAVLGTVTVKNRILSVSRITT